LIEKIWLEGWQLRYPIKHGRRKCSVSWSDRLPMTFVVQLGNFGDGPIGKLGGPIRLSAAELTQPLDQLLASYRGST
jgi:hypothetical protein